MKSRVSFVALCIGFVLGCGDSGEDPEQLTVNPHQPSRHGPAAQTPAAPGDPAPVGGSGTPGGGSTDGNNPDGGTTGEGTTGGATSTGQGENPTPTPVHSFDFDDAIIELAIINGLKENDSIPAGRVMKRVTGGVAATSGGST